MSKLEPPSSAGMETEHFDENDLENPRRTVRSRPVEAASFRPLDEEHGWIKKHAASYPNHWLAVLHSDLLIASPEYAEVNRYLQAHSEIHDALVHYQSS